MTEQHHSATSSGPSLPLSPSGREHLHAHLASLSAHPALADLLGIAEEERIEAGYGHTLREILQQPLTLGDTAERAANLVHREVAGILRERAVQAIALTGSGSSHYAAEVAAPFLARLLGMPVAAIPTGDLLTHGRAALPAPGPVLLVSLARSGNSPESAAAIRVASQEAPDTIFLHITCNANGNLATMDAGGATVHRLILHPWTNDESLVMTSSFTSLALGSLALGFHSEASEYQRHSRKLCEVLSARLPSMFSEAASLPFDRIRRAVFLGNGCQFGAAREAALKLTEMTAGEIVSFPETFLGLRHGPMAAVHEDTLIVAFLPPDQRGRKYATDLIAELNRKQLGCATLQVHPDGAISNSPAPDAESAEMDTLPEPWAAIIGVVAGQCIGFHACRALGFRPDAPSAGGVITRVVEPFPLYH